MVRGLLVEVSKVLVVAAHAPERMLAATVKMEVTRILNFKQKASAQRLQGAFTSMYESTYGSKTCRRQEWKSCGIGRVFILAPASLAEWPVVVRDSAFRLRLHDDS